MVAKAKSVYADPCAAPERETVLDAIKVVESRGAGAGELYPHRDRKSWGHYGLTQIAIDELVRVGKLTPGTTVQDVCVGETDEREVAGLYLDECLSRARRASVYGECATYLHAAMVYHAGTAERLMLERIQYGLRVRRAIEEAAR